MKRRQTLLSEIRRSNEREMAKLQPGWARVLMLAVATLLLLSAPVVRSTIQGWEEGQAQEIVDQRLAAIERQIQGGLKERSASLEKLAGEWRAVPEVEGPEFETRSTGLMAGHPDLIAMALVAGDGTVRFSQPERFVTSVERAHRLAIEQPGKPFESAIREGKVRFSAPIEAAASGKVFLGYFPIQRPAHSPEALLGVLHLGLAVEAIGKEMVPPGYFLELLDGYKPILTQGTRDPQRPVYPRVFQYLDTEWRIVLQPDAALAQSVRTRWPAVAFYGMLGLGAGLLLLTAYQLLWARQMGRETKPVEPVSGLTAAGAGAVSGILPRRDLTSRWVETLGELAEAAVAIEPAAALDAAPPIAYVNPAFERLTGYSRSAILGKTMRALQSLKAERTPFDELQRAQKARSPYEGVLTIQKFDGTLCRVRGKLETITEANEQLLGWVLRMEPTEPLPALIPVALEETLAVPEVRVEPEPVVAAVTEPEAPVAPEPVVAAASSSGTSWLTVSPIAAQLCDELGTVSLWNAAAEQLFGWKREEVLGRVSPVLPAGFLTNWLQRAVDATAPLEAEIRRETKDGTQLDLAVWARRHDERPEAPWLVFFADMSARQRRAEELTIRAESAEKYRLMLEHSGDLVALVNAAGELQYSSAGAAETFGLTAHRFGGRPIAEAVPADAEREALRQAIAEVAAIGRPQTCLVALADVHEQERRLETVIQPSGLPNLLLMVGRDVTARESIRKQEESAASELEASRERIERLEEENRRLAQEVDQLSAQMAAAAQQLEEQLSAGADQLTEANAAQRDLEAQRDAARAEFQKAQEEKAELQSQFDRISSEVAAAAAELDRQLAAKGLEIALAQQGQEQLQTQLADMARQTAEATAQVEQELSLRERQVAALEARIAELASLPEQKAELEAKFAQAAQESAARTAALEARIAELQSAEQQKVELEAKLVELTKESAAHTAALEARIAELASLPEEKADLEAKFAQAAQESAARTALLEARMAELESAEQQKAELEAKLEELTKLLVELDSARQQNSELEAKFAQAAQESAARTALLEARIADLQSTEQQKAELEAKLEELAKQAEARIGELELAQQAKAALEVRVDRLEREAREANVQQESEKQGWASRIEALAAGVAEAQQGRDAVTRQFESLEASLRFEREARELAEERERQFIQHLTALEAERDRHKAELARQSQEHQQQRDTLVTAWEEERRRLDAELAAAIARIGAVSEYIDRQSAERGALEARVRELEATRTQNQAEFQRRAESLAESLARQAELRQELERTVSDQAATIRQLRDMPPAPPPEPVQVEIPVPVSVPVPVPVADGELLADVEDAVMLWSPNFQIVSFNPAATRLFGAAVAAEQPVDELYAGWWQDPLFETIRAAVLENGRWSGEQRLHRPDGRRLILEGTLTARRDATGNVTGYLSVQRDLSARRLQEEAQRASEERYALAVRSTNDGLFDWNLLTEEIYYAPRWKQMLGYAEDDILGTPEEWFMLVHQADITNLKAQIARHLKNQSEVLEVEYRIRRADGSYVWMEARAQAVRDEKGRAVRMVGSQSDISEQKAVEDQLLHEAFHDALTGLPNRTLFMDRLGVLVDRARHGKNPKPFAVLFLDLDRFKYVNDSLGHLAGDQLLIETARRLQASIGEGDTVARYGGDEFTILADNMPGPWAVQALSEKLQRELARPIVYDGQEIYTSLSIGSTHSSLGYERPFEMLRDADTALYRAKDRGRSRHVAFDQAMHTEARARLQIEADLRRALERHEFQVVYLPMVALGLGPRQGRLAGFEALVRWNHPRRGLLSPADFLPAAEETGLVLDIDRWVLRQACAQMRSWHERFGHRGPLHVSVNLSGQHFSQVDLAQQVRRVLEQARLGPEFLRIELTERILKTPSIQSIFSELADLKVQLNIDDFGTSASSLAYLSQFPIDRLKIDRSFVKSLNGSGRANELIRGMLQLAHQLKINVVAEGVENQEQLDLLRKFGCEFAQGYLFAQPLDAPAAETLIESEQRW